MSLTDKNVQTWSRYNYISGVPQQPFTFQSKIVLQNDKLKSLLPFQIIHIW